MVYFVTNRAEQNMVSPNKGLAIIDSLPTVSPFAGSNYVGLDLETTGLVFNRDEILLIVLGNENDQYVIDWYGFKDSVGIASFFDTANRYIGHNLLFDLPFLMHRGVSFSNDQIYDTMIAEQVLIKGTKKSASLKESLGRRLKITDIDKDIRMEFVKMRKFVPQFDNRHIEYAASDVKNLFNLRGKQMEHLIRFKQVELTELNNKNVVVSARMKVNGMMIDGDKWVGLYKQMQEHTESLEILMDKQLEKHGIIQRRVRNKKRAQQIDMFGGNSVEVTNKNVLNINYASPSQCLGVFKALGLPIPKSAKEDKKSVGEATLQQYLISYPDTILKDFIETLIDYKISVKLSKSFGKKWLDKNVDERGRIHATFAVNSTSTGRYKCIEESQLVMTVGGYKPIKKIKVGDYVYSYDSEGKLRINKVLNKIYSGYKKVIKINYASQGRGSRKGSLVCTPDHLIRVNQGEWKKAVDLTTKDKLWHLYRAQDHLEGVAIRPRLYGVNSFMEKEQDIIKKEFFKVPSEFHVHHVDHNSANNSLLNLAIMTCEAHSRYHSLNHKLGGDYTKEGKERKYVYQPSKNRIVLTKYQVLRMIYASGGSPTKVIMDFQTFKDKAFEVGIDLSLVRKRFSKGLYISRARVKKALFNSINTEKAARTLGIGTKALKELCSYYSVEYSNHRFESIEELDYANVYDLTIENDSNFIVQELNVHNCSSPNLQQIPSNVNYRQCFIAPKGRKIWTCDYSSAELRILASLSRDSVMLGILSQGGDLHSYAATPVLRYLRNADDVIVSKKENADFRTSMKNVIFGLLYGAGTNKIAELLDISKFKAEKVYDILTKTFPSSFEYLEKMSRFGVSNGYIVVDEKLNQRRWFEAYFDNGGYLDRSERGIVERASKNTPIQATNGQMMKTALLYVDEYIQTSNLSSFIVSTVHDEMVVEVGQGEEEHCLQFENLMKRAGDEFLDGVQMEVESKLLDYWSK
jgi:DNA polymerase I-like protein with 3'-5' exonuclease and polymerase domains